MAVWAPWDAGEDVTADELNTLIAQETMEWTALSTLGTFGTNFSAGARTPRMRKVIIAGTEVWEFEGSIAASAFASNTTLTMFTFAVGPNRVASEHGFMAYASNSGHYAVRLGFMATGIITGSVPTAAGTGVSSVWLDSARITNPTL